MMVIINNPHRFSERDPIQLLIPLILSIKKYLEFYRNLLAFLSSKDGKKLLLGTSESISRRLFRSLYH